MKYIVSLLILRDKVEVVYREPSHQMLLCNPPRPAGDHVWKEIWGIVNGELHLLETIRGTHEPAYYTEERITFKS